MATLSIRNVDDNDAALLRSFAQLCPPLDVHTPYTYWVLCHVFGDGCFIALADGVPVGFITSVSENQRALLWQIGILDSHRGIGVSHLIIDTVVERARSLRLDSVEMSIDPNNVSSMAAFGRYASKHGLPFDQVGAVDLVDENDHAFHEVESLFEIRIAA